MAEPLSQRAFSDLIGSIYDCALDPDRWEGTLAEILDVLRAQMAVLHLDDLTAGRVSLLKCVGMVPQWQRESGKHSVEITARIALAMATLPSLDEPYVISRHLSRAEWEASPYVRECLGPQGIVDTMDLFLLCSTRRFSALGIARNARQGLIGEREVGLARLLLPHLRRAVTVSDVLEARTIESARLAEALDALRCGVVLTDPRGAVLHANRAAERMLCEGSPVREVRGALQARLPAAAQELRIAIALAAGDEANLDNCGCAIRLTAPEAAPVFAHVLPLSGGAFRTRLRPAAVAAVFIGATGDEHAVAETVADAFGLTAAETRVLAALLAGHSLAETAADLGVAASTARTHLDNIFLKTGVARQAELVRLAMQVAPPTGRMRESTLTRRSHSPALHGRV